MALVLAVIAGVPPIVWSIAGSDSGGGAGIQADLHAFHALGAHGCTVITAMTAQNSREVRHVEFASREMLRHCIAVLRDDLPPQAVKLGMLGSDSVIAEVAPFVQEYEGMVVCDPVMVTTSGARLLDEGASEALQRDVFPYCSLVTPNLQEAEALLKRKLESPAEVEAGASELLRAGCRAVLIKGGHTVAHDGHSSFLAQDYFSDGTTSAWLTLPRLPTDETHGTGCTLSSATAALLANGLPLIDAVVLAKAYVHQGIAAATRLGSGPGPVVHTSFPSSSDSMPWLTTDVESARQRPCFPRCDGSAARGLLPIMDTSARVATVVEAGAKDVQLRLKGVSGEMLLNEVREAQRVCAANGARLWVNDHWETALACGAYGVHIGQEDLSAMSMTELERIASAGVRLGISTHSYSELARAIAVRPSYISLGPVFQTSSKRVEFSPQGLLTVSRWRKLIPADTPFMAIGGISKDVAPSVLEAGADSIAVISALTESPEGLSLADATRSWNLLWSTASRA